MRLFDDFCNLITLKQLFFKVPNYCTYCNNLLVKGPIINYLVFRSFGTNNYCNYLLQSPVYKHQLREILHPKIMVNPGFIISHIEIYSLSDHSEISKLNTYCRELQMKLENGHLTSWYKLIK